MPAHTPPETESTPSARLAELRGALLHAETRAEAIHAAVEFLVRDVGPTVVLPGDIAVGAGRLHVETAPEDAAASMRAMAVDEAICIALPGGTPPSFVLVGSTSAAAQADEATVRAVTFDLSRAIDLVESRDEVGGLRKSVREKEVLLRHTTEALFKDVHTVVSALGQLERRDAAMKEELHRALRFQRATIDRLPTHERLLLDAIYLAADVISADFYDVSVLERDHVRLFVADATGHGIAAALATMFVKAEYESHKRSSPSPSALLGAMNDVLTSRYEMLDLRCTAICVDIHPEARRMLFSSAAHPGPAVARADGVEFFPGAGTFIGLRSSIAFATVETRLEPSDLVVAFSDGLLDAGAAGGQAFGRDRVSALASRAREEPMLFCPRLVSELSEFVGEGRALLDDVTVVALSLKA